VKRAFCLSVILALGLASVASADGGLKFQYTIERESGGAVSEANFLKGFDLKDGLRLKVKLGQASYCYVITSATHGRYRLVFPDPETKRGQGIEPNTWARLPKSTFVRLGDDPGVERIYLVVSQQRIPEFEETFGKGELVLSESLALDVRDRYQGAASYTRDLDGDTISVKYKPKNTKPPVVVEEISIRAR